MSKKTQIYKPTPIEEVEVSQPSFFTLGKLMQMEADNNTNEDDTEFLVDTNVVGPPPPMEEYTGSGDETAKKSGYKKKRVTKSKRAGVTFPVSRVKKHLKTKISRVSADACIYLAAVGDYLVAELTEGLGDICKQLRNVELGEKKRVVIGDNCFNLLKQSDEDLRELLGGATLGSRITVNPLSKDQLKKIYNEDKLKEGRKKRARKNSKSVNEASKIERENKSKRKKRDGEKRNGRNDEPRGEDEKRNGESEKESAETSEDSDAGNIQGGKDKEGEKKRRKGDNIKPSTGEENQGEKVEITKGGRRTSGNRNNRTRRTHEKAGGVSDLEKFKLSKAGRS